jgi:hypothetical protein
MAARFKMTDVGPVEWLLGIIEVQRVTGVFKLSQAKYISDMLERFGMSDCKPVKTPLDVGVRLSADRKPADDGTDQDRHDMATVPYRSAVGSLMYLMVGTRPDIAAAVGAVGRFASNPGPQHWRIFRYLRGTTDWALHLGGTSGEIKLSIWLLRR